MRASPIRRPPNFLARLRSLLGADAASVRQSLVALAMNSSTSFVAGAFLSSISDTFRTYPGLLVLMPAAIGLRGNVFGSFGNRLSTAIHAGTFRLSTRRDTILGQNIQAAMLLTVSLSLILAGVAKLAAVVFHVSGGSIGLLDLATVSIVGGALGSTVVLGFSLVLARGAVRYGWDLDAVASPVVSVLGDVLTLPALYLATFLLGYHLLTPTIGVVLSVGALALLVYSLRSRLAELRRITWESLPVLTAAGCMSVGAGLALVSRFDVFDAYKGLFVLQLAHLSSGGAMGGILSGRLSTKMLLGTADPTTIPTRESRRDIGLLFVLAVPVYLFNGLGAQAVASLTNGRTPGWIDMVGVSLVAGLAGMILVVAASYVSTVLAVRNGLDPDNFGIPVVSSTVDFFGAVVLVAVIALFGIRA